MKLTRLALGQAMRKVIYADHGRAVHAADAIDCDPQDLRRAWGTGNQSSRHHSIQRLLDYFDKLGYEVHFTLVKKASKDEYNSTSPSNRSAHSDIKI